MNSLGFDSAKVFMGRRAELMARLRYCPRNARRKALEAELRELVTEELRRECQPPGTSDEEQEPELKWWQR